MQLPDATFPAMSNKTLPYCYLPISKSGLSRRNFLLISAGVITATALAGLSGCRPNKPLKIASQAWPGYAFLYLAHEQGFISNEKIEIMQTANLGESSSALAKGQVDGAALTLEEGLHILDQGISLQVVLVLDASAGADAVMVKPGIQHLAQLKGKQIGVEPSTLSDIMYAKILEVSGLNSDDIKRVRMNFDHVKAWEIGNLDAIITYDPNITLFEQKGLLRIFDSRSMPGRIVDVLAIRTDVADRYSTTLTELVAGHFTALNLWQKNQIDTTFLLAKILSIKPDEVKEVFKGLDLPDASFNRHYLSAPAEEMKKSVGEIAQIMIRDKLIKQHPAIDNLFTADFLPGDL
ncbi:MAG: substrate-binding domain-containing protein [Methylococcales bacterium]